MTPLNKKFVARLKSGESNIIFNHQNFNFNKILELYTFPEIQNEIEFDSNRKLESDEWFYIEPNETQKIAMLNDYFQAIENSGSLNLVTSENYNSINVLYLIEKNEEGTIKIIFSKVLPRYRVYSKNYLIFDGEPDVKTQSNSIDITGKVDAYWNGRRLFFKSYSTIVTLFKGIEDFYIIATKEERDQFLNNGFFEFPSGQVNLHVKERNLKRIAFIVREKNIDFSNSEIRQKYKNYSEKYSVGLVFTSGNQIEIKNNPDLSKTLQVIEEHFYTSEISGEKREAEHTKTI